MRQHKGQVAWIQIKREEKRVWALEKWQAGLEMFDGQEHFGETNIASCSLSGKGKEKTLLTSFLTNALEINSGKHSTLKEETQKIMASLVLVQTHLFLFLLHSHSFSGC